MEAVAQQVEVSLAAVHAPSTPNAQRQEAQAVLDSVRGISPEGRSLPPQQAAHVVSVALVLTKRNRPAEVRHFGFNCLLETINGSWFSFDDSQKGHLKEEVLRILGEEMRGIDEEDFHLKGKATMLVSAVAKREWPERWDALLPSISQLVERGSHGQQELAIKVLQCLPEEITEYNADLDDPRRNTLLAALTANLTIVLPLLFGALERAFRQWKTNPADTASLAIARAVLSAMTAYVDWVPMSTLLSPLPALGGAHAGAQSMPFAQAFTLLLDEPSCRREAVECLLVLAGKKVVEKKSEETAEMGGRLLPVLEAVCTYMERLQLPPPPLSSQQHGFGDVQSRRKLDEEYAYYKRAVQMIAVLACRHLAVLMKQGAGALLARYVELLARMCKSSSWVVSFTVLQHFWMLSLRNAKFCDREEFRSKLPAILDGFVSVLPRLGDPTVDWESTLTGSPEHCSAEFLSYALLRAQYSAADIDTGSAARTEWRAFYAQLRNLSLINIRAVAAIDPVISFDVLGERLKVATARCSAMEARAPVCGGIPLVQPRGETSEATLTMETEASLAEAILSAVPMDCMMTIAGAADWKKKNRNFPITKFVGTCVDRMDSMTEGLMSLDWKEPHFLRWLLHSVQSLTRRFAYDPRNVPRFCTWIFDLLEHYPSPEYLFSESCPAALAGPVWDARRKICSCLSGLAIEAGESLIPYIGELMPRIEALTAAGRLLDSELVILHECLALVASSTKSYDRTAEICNRLMAPVEAVLGHAGVWDGSGGGCMGSLDNFLTLLGLDVEPNLLSIARVLGPITDNPLRTREPLCPGNVNEYLYYIRKRLYLCVQLAMVLYRRVEAPTDLNVAMEGGFATTITDSQTGEPVAIMRRHPMTLHLKTIFPVCFQIMRILGELFLPEGRNQLKARCLASGINASIAEKCLDITQAERDVILGIELKSGDHGYEPYARGAGVGDDPSNTERHGPQAWGPVLEKRIQVLQNWMKGMRESALWVLAFGSSRGADAVYDLSHPVGATFMSEFTRTCLFDITTSPLRHLKILLRNTLGALLKVCPAESRESHLDPLLRALVGPLYSRIGPMWEALAARSEGKVLVGGGRDLEAPFGEDDDDADEEEVIEDKLLRDVTREYMTMLMLPLLPQAVEIAKREVQYAAQGLVPKQALDTYGRAIRLPVTAIGSKYPESLPEGHGGQVVISVMEWALTRDADIAAPLAYGAIALLGAPDVQVISRALQHCTRILKRACEPRPSEGAPTGDTRLHFLVGNSMMGMCILLLARPAWAAYQVDLLVLIGQIVYKMATLTRISGDPSFVAHHRGALASSFPAAAANGGAAIMALEERLQAQQGATLQHERNQRSTILAFVREIGGEGALGKGGMNTSSAVSLRTLPKRVFQQFARQGPPGDGNGGSDFIWGDTLFAA